MSKKVEAYNNGSSPTNVSVIVPVYNVEKYLQRCVDSILDQSFRLFEYILVDDASTDNCPDICAKYQAKDKRIRVIHKDRNEGSSQARKTGLQAALGDYILFIDGDDWLEFNMIEKMYNYAKGGEYDVVFAIIFWKNQDIRT
jgi:glycosyltransferase involved in cell wall biosynthesis